MRWKGIIFDRDGTLFESLPLILKCFNYAIDPYASHHPTDEEWFAAFGPSEPDVIAKLIGEQNKDQAYTRFYDCYTRNSSEIHLFPGMRELLIRLNTAGVKLILFTGGGRQSTQFCLEKTGILQLFDQLITGDDVSKPKPDPEGILKAMKLCELHPSNTLVAGDAAADMVAGRKAGAATALAKWSGFPQAKETSMEADYVFDSVEEFERFLFGGN